VLSPAALAGGYFLPGRGVRAMSRGGAYVVAVDDSTAHWYNPAQLAGQKGTRLHIDAALGIAKMRFMRYPVAEVEDPFLPVENGAPPQPGASAGISSDFDLEQVVVGFSFYTPYGNWGRYPEDGAQRYSTIRSENLGYFLQASAAWEPFAGLRLGAGVNFLTLMINDTHAVNSFPGLFGMPEDRDLDGLVQLVAEDTLMPAGVVGLWVHPGAWIDFLEGVELGLSFMSSRSVSADGHMRVRLPSHIYYDDVTLDPEEPGINIALELPWIVRAGARYRYEDIFDVELDLVWEAWSCLENVAVRTKQPTYYRDIPTIGDYLLMTPVLPRNYEDVWSVRFGGSARPLDWLVLRAGFLWESGAPPDEYFTVATPDSNKFGIAFGLGAILWAFEIDFGYMHLFFDDRDISNEVSLARQVNPNNPEGATYVGGGKYSASHDIVGLSLLVRVEAFWEPPGSEKKLKEQ